MTGTGWVALVGRIVGNPEHWDTVYSWDGSFHHAKESAIRAGFIAAESDDFNVGKVENGQLVWFGWMNDKHPAADYAAVASQFGWSTGDDGDDGDARQRAAGDTLTVMWHPDAIRTAIEHAAAIVQAEGSAVDEHGDDVYEFPGGSMTLMDLCCLIDAAQHVLTSTSTSDT